MFKFELFLERNLLREYFFDKKLSITIGRRPSHDIHLDHMGVSSDHAKIYFFPALLLEDLGSKNGTMLNEQRIDRTAKLSHGDVISITKYRLRFIDETKMMDEHNPWDDTETISTWLVDIPNEEAPRMALEKGMESLQNLKMTPREFECLFWLSRGKTTGEISHSLKISERTVNFHITNICEKLGAANRTQAIAIAVSLKLIEP